MKGLRALLMLVLLPGADAQAALGASVASIADDAARHEATVREVPATGYRLFVLETLSGLVVREYVDAAQTVFAVSWAGPVMPDLAQLLGAHHASFTQAATQLVLSTEV